MKKNRILLFLLFIIIISTGILFFQYGNDFYWHLAIGKYIINNNTIPFTDVFSWYAINNNLEWTSHEWLFEVIIYFFNLIFSNSGAFIYVLITLILISIVIFRLNKQNFNKNPFYTICWALCGLLIFVNKTLPRPHLFSFLFFAITIYIANSIKDKNNKLFYIAPLISILWTNIHGGSSNLSYIIYGIFLLFSIKEKDYLKIKKYIFAFITSIIGILINPHGIKMIFYPYINMTYNTMINCIDEWQSLNILSVDGFFYILFIISIFYIIIKNRNKIKLIEIFLLIIFIVLGVKSTRFMPYLYIIYSTIIPNYWKKCKIKIDLLPILVFLIITISFLFIFVYEKRNFQKVSPEIINYLKTNETTLYNSYNLGGYLIYNDIKVFVDSRADLYVETILCDVCKIEKENKMELLDKYNFDTFLVEKKSKTYKYLSSNSKYELLLHDKNNALFILKPEN